MKILLPVLILAFLAIGGPGWADNPPLSSYLPAAGEVPGWQPEGRPQVVEGEQLFTLINGGADVYYEYGFRRAAVQTYKNPAGKTINLEIYEMNDPAGAYGIFSYKSAGCKKISLGQEALLADYFLIVWKGRFHLTLTGSDAEKDTLTGLTAIGAAVDAKISDQGRRPLLVELISGLEPRPDEVKYYRGPLGLSPERDVRSWRIFGVKDGAAGYYSAFKMFVFAYRDEGESLKWFQSALEGLKKDPRVKDVVVKDRTLGALNTGGKRLFVESYDKYILLVSENTPGASGNTLDQIKQKIKQK